MIGIPDEDGVLRYAGRVGTGFTAGRAGPARRGCWSRSRAGQPASTGRQPPKHTRFVEPRLVARVDFNERTQAGTLRQPSYKGLRDDIAPEDVRFG